jgi:hypothetical protein
MARFKTLGYVMMVIGLAFLVAVVPAGLKIADGYDSLNAFSEAEGVALNYNSSSIAAPPKVLTTSWRCSPRTGPTRSSRANSILMIRS